MNFIAGTLANWRMKLELSIAIKIIYSGFEGPFACGPFACFA
jgi:hypothetical protein